MKKTIFTLTMMAFVLISYSKVPFNNTYSSSGNEFSLKQNSFSTKEIVNDYLRIKNFLVNGDSKSAAMAAVAFEVSVINTSGTLSISQKNVLSKISLEAKKHSNVIASNSGKIDMQRKSLKNLSTSINDLITTFGTEQTLYQNFCPMYESGSIWISEIKEIKNPYYGNQMLKCGSIKKQINE